MKRIADGIFKIEIPFEDIYTSSFVLENNGKYIVADSGACANDANTCIIPKLKERNITPSYLVCSHMHGDHSGGVRALISEYPNAVVCGVNECLKTFENSKIIADKQLLLERFELIPLPGHSEDSLGIFDTKTKTFLSFDCLQQRGVSKYGGGFCNFEKYLHSVEVIRALYPKAIAASHEFYPLGSIAAGERDVCKYLDECEKDAEYFNNYIVSRKDKEPSEVAATYNNEHPGFPTISEGAVKAIFN